MSNADSRPDPDALLAVARQEEKKSSAGRLTRLLGRGAGVGKTYSMLEAARAKLAEGLDVVVGVVETHGRAETKALLEGMEVLPRRMLEHRGVKLAEFDLDAALARRPALILVDELAHTNAPGTRHAKRWQDVEELLDSGHRRLHHPQRPAPGEPQRRGRPDHRRGGARDGARLHAASDAESLVLVDLPPDDLLQRLQEGKVYLPEQAEWAAQHFFKPGNLTALRELALRITAERVNSEVLIYHQGQAGQRIWPTAERLLVCVGPAPTSAKLVRATKRMADGLHANWLALYVETPDMAKLPAEERNRAIQHLQLAKQLGAETVTLSGDQVAQEVVDFALSRNVTKIVIGKPLGKRWKDRFFGNFVDEIIYLSGDIDVYVIRGDSEGAPRSAFTAPHQPVRNLAGVMQGLLMVALVHRPGAFNAAALRSGQHHHGLSAGGHGNLRKGRTLGGHRHLGAQRAGL